jgi:hypothetical protein
MLASISGYSPLSIWLLVWYREREGEKKRKER